MNLTVRNAASLLNVSEKTIYRWIKQGALPVYKVQDQYRFNRAELLEWATSRRLNVSPEIFAEPESGSSPLPSLAEAFQSGGIYYRVEGGNREEVLRSVVQTLRLPDEVDQEFLYRVLLAREELGSTAIGRGIAIPHVRNPLVLHVPRPMIGLCFLEKAIDFGALDGEPVRILFTLISPTVRSHLHILSRLTYALREPSFMELIQREGSREEILGALREIEASFAVREKAEAHSS